MFQLLGKEGIFGSIFMLVDSYSIKFFFFFWSAMCSEVKELQWGYKIIMYNI